MSLERICRTEVATVLPDTSLLEVAQLMSDRRVGSVVVIEDHHPVGILTDRDIVVKVVAVGKDPKVTRAGAVMTPNPALVNVNDDPLDATRIMRDRGLRRLPVVDENGNLLGMVTLDDVLGLMGAELSNVAEAIGKELTGEA